MHVLQIAPGYFPTVGGVEVVVQKLSETFTARSIKVTVFSTDLHRGLPRVDEIHRVKVKRFARMIGDPIYLPEPRFLRAILQEDADIIHVHNIHTLLPFIAALFKHRRQKLVLQPHYHRFGQSAFRHTLLTLYRLVLSRLVFPRVNAVVVNSAYEEKIVSEDFPRTANVLMIPEGIDTSEVKRVKPDPAEPRRILYVGSLRRYKNVDRVIEGFSSLVKKERADYQLVIVGGSGEGDLADLSRVLGVASLVEWKKDLSREQLLDEYSHASVLILLSSLESFSRTVYEALLIGVPVVVLNSGALATLVEQGLAEGVNTLDSEEIADALVRAIGKKHPRLSGDTGSFLDWSDYARRIEDVYQGLLRE